MTELRCVSLAVFVVLCLSPNHALQLRRFRRRHIATVPRAPRRQRGFVPAALTGQSPLSFGHWFAGTPTTGDLNNSGNSTSTNDAIAQAAEFRRKAQQLKAEAASLELSLQVAKLQASQKKAADIALWMETLFHNGRPRTAEAVARVIQENRYTESQLSTLLDALYLQWVDTSSSSPETAPATAGDRNATAMEPTAITYIQLLLDATKILDNDNDDTSNNRRWSGRVHSTLQSQLKELNRRREAEFKRKVVAHVTSKIVEALQPTLATNATAVVAATSSSNTTDSNSLLSPRPLVPPWIPPGLVAEVNTSQSSLNPADVLLIQNSVLQKSHFFCTSVESIPKAAIFRGNVRRGKKSEAPNSKMELSEGVVGRIQEELQKEAGLSDRVRLFVLNDPQWRPRGDNPSGPQPIVLAIPKQPVLAPSRSRVLYAAAAMASLLATLRFAIQSYALNPNFYKSVILDHDMSVVASCWPIVCGLVAIHAVHETAHQLVARQSGLRLRWPLPLPSVSFGSLGCITAPRSFPANRTTVLDFSLSGPVASMAVSLAFLTIGCCRTVRASEATLLAYPFVTAGSLRSSFLAGTLLTMLVPKMAVLHVAQPVPVHPLVIAGWSGMIASAFHLLPILRLDGGRACTAAMGSRFAAVTTAWAMLMMVSCGPRAMIWALMIVLLHRRPEVNALDEVTPVNRVRVGAWIASVVVAAAALLPFPGTRGIF